MFSQGVDLLTVQPNLKIRTVLNVCGPQNDDGQRSEIEESVSKLQDSLDFLRLSVKYMVFDLEATRRENVYLRKLVEQIRRDSTRRDEGNDNHFFGENSSD